MTSTSIGTSTACSIEWMVAKMRQIRPRAVLDVGCGWGRWGVLAREFLELWEHRYQREDWRTRIVGLDIHPGTWTPLHDYIYDMTAESDIARWPLAVDEFDLIIACDVLEHLPKDSAKQLLWRFRGAAAHVLVGVPLGPDWRRPGFDGNAHEAHISVWEFSDLDLAASRKLIPAQEDGLPYALAHFSRP